MQNYIVYYRVSTKGQGMSRLGLEAQQIEVERFLVQHGGHMFKSFTEVESGGNNKRPILKQAIDTCRLYGLPLLIAKLDRLSRSASFLLTLQDSDIKFVCADMPGANNLTVGMMALVAQEEREAISKRTKAALAAAKARGTVLGGYRPNSPELTEEHRRMASDARTSKANDRAEQYRDTINSLIQQGTRTRSGIARELTRMQIPRPNGDANEWHAIQVTRVMKRLGMD